jgi:hypothetical protein
MADGVIGTNIGGTFAICATPQASDLDAAAFAALTWIVVGKIGSVGEFGVEQPIVDYDTWAGNVLKGKGAKRPGDPEVEYARDELDAGQDALRVAAGLSTAHAVRVIKQDGTVFYSRALVAGPSMPQGRGEDADIESVTLGLVQIPIRV